MQTVYLLTWKVFLLQCILIYFLTEITTDVQVSVQHATDIVIFTSLSSESNFFITA